MFIKLAKLRALPSCGVAESITSVSELLDNRWAKRLRCDPVPRSATL